MATATVTATVTAAKAKVALVPVPEKARIWATVTTLNKSPERVKTCVAQHVFPGGPEAWLYFDGPKDAAIALDADDSLPPNRPARFLCRQLPDSSDGKQAAETARSGFGASLQPGLPSCAADMLFVRAGGDETKLSIHFHQRSGNRGHRTKGRLRPMHRSDWSAWRLQPGRRLPAGVLPGKFRKERATQNNRDYPLVTLHSRNGGLVLRKDRDAVCTFGPDMCSPERHSVPWRENLRLQARVAQGQQTDAAALQTFRGLVKGRKVPLCRVGGNADNVVPEHTTANRGVGLTALLTSRGSVDHVRTAENTFLKRTKTKG